MSTTCVYSDIVLPTATWYEKNDLNTSDMHPFIHPLTRGGGPGLGSAHGLGHLQGHRRGVLRGRARGAGSRDRRRADADAARHAPANSRSPTTCSDWKRGETDPMPGRTMPSVTVVERDYPNLYARFTSIGPLLEKLGNGGKGIGWNTEHEVEFLARAQRHRPPIRAARSSRPTSTPSRPF